MLKYDELNEDNFIFFAAQHYYNPKCHDIEDFYEDMKRFKYLKRLLNKYHETGKLSERLILNHIIIIFNLFGIPAGLKMVEYKFDYQQLTVIKPFLLYLKYIKENQYTHIDMDQNVIDALRKL
jgi:hypothetical protein